MKSSPPVGFRKRLWRSGTWLRCDYVRGRPGLRDPVGVGGVARLPSACGLWLVKAMGQRGQPGDGRGGSLGRGQLERQLSRFVRHVL